MERYRDGKVPIEKFELSSRSSYDPHKVLPPIPIDNCLDIALQNGVKHLVFDYISYSVPILTILAAKSLRKLVLAYCTLSLASGVVNQNSLRKLSLSHVKLDKNMFETLLNSCPLIDTLIFVHCIGLEKVYLRKIKTVYLKVLKIRDSEGMWEIDAPNLVSFEYTGKQIPEFKIARQLENSKIYLYRLDNINVDWFCKLRKFLSKSTGASWSQVSIRFKECTEIKMEHLQQHYRVGATTQVDVLEVNVLFQYMECSSFVDALLWSCLPKRLNLQPRLNLFTVFSDRLMYMKNSTIRPWHSQLKETKAFGENNQLLQLGSEQITESVLPSWGSERKGG
ncbi:hypothetical protein KY290_027188 [Solanum tuberosum]|uniref:At1g61320/AtMIF1 LRR domain-containing protein n=1 Tax=Solanum tuberosum TaxID=4113 RepID=A0ABQ7UE81_SOLTU|nr:hypothetical protein KY290_027188 [Solanum tuberosum]